MTPTEKALGYANDVLDGTIPANKWIKLACKRFLDDLEKSESDDYPYEYSVEKADRAVNFMEKMPHTKGKWRAKKLKLIFEPWQCFIECNIFGWIRKDTGIRRFRISFELIPRKNGKALEISTPIMTTNGWKRHDELKEGDFVFSPDGLPVKVLWNSGSYEGLCHDMRFSDNQSIIAHENHEWVTNRTWYTKRAHGKAGQVKLPTVTSKEIFNTLRGGARNDVVHTVNICKPLSTAQKDLLIKPYTLGAWLGDGTSARQQITSMDKEVTEAIEADGYQVTFAQNNGSKADTFNIKKDGREQKEKGSFAEDLKILEVFKNKHIPQAYLESSEHDRWELLRGLLDTDGFISKAGQIEFCTTNSRISDGVVDLAYSLGIKVTAKKSRATLYGKDCGDKFRIMFFPSSNEPLFKIKRKLDRQNSVPLKKSRRNTRSIVSAEPCGTHTVNCIEVEGGLYVAGKGLVPTHNSARAAARAIYMFVADNEAAAEIYCGATSEKQAHEVFRPAWMMVNQLPKLRQRFSIDQGGNVKNPGTMYVMEDMSKFEAIVGKPGDGSSPHCAIIDEYHEHDTDHMVDTMQTGMGAREQPLLSIITTAGSNLGGPCYEMQQEMQRILEGTTQDETAFICIYGIDIEDDWSSPEALVKANPNYNISVFGDFLLAQLNQAKRSASKQNAYRTKHLNEWVGAKTAWMNMVAWNGQKFEGLKMSDFKGCPVRVSVDIASKKDVSAVDVTFEKEGSYYSFKKFFAPETAAEENEKYMEFVTADCLELTDGSMIDQGAIEEYLLSLRVEIGIELSEITFDEWQADYMMTRLMAKKLTVIRYPFNTRHVSEPMKHLEAMVLEGKYYHDGNAMMNWMMGNVAAKADARNNIFPRKAREADPKCKIDGVAAAIMSMGRFMTIEEAAPDYKLFFV